MADGYTPTTDEARAHWREAWHPRNTKESDASFDRFIAALRAEWEAEQSWEYECKLDDFEWTRIADVTHFQHCRGEGRRRKAGPWLPVDENGSEHA